LKVTPAITAQARIIVRDHVLLSAGSALIPEPILCTTAVTAAHLRMLDELSRHYQKPFDAKAVRVLLVGAMGGGVMALFLGRPGSRKAITALAPVIIPLWFIGGCLVAGTLTHLMGLAFIRHYERGGTYDSFDWAKFREKLLALVGLDGAKAKIEAALQPA
jgi:hypothetical protein